MKKKKIPITPYLLILPVLISSVVFSFYPLFKTMVSSVTFTNVYGEWTGWAGGRFWKMVFTNEDTWKMLGITLKFAAANFIGTFVLAMLLALLTFQKSRFGRVSQMLYAMPVAVASAISAIIFKSFFSTNGILNSWLGTDIAWLIDVDKTFWVVTFVTVWCHIAGSYIYLLAGFRSVSKDLLEAATIDGAGWWTRVFHIMIPMASPQIFAVVFLSIVNALKTFTQIKLLSQGGPAGETTTLMYDIYLRATTHGEFEYACCLALIMFVLIFVTTRIQFVLENKFVYYE